MLLRPKQRSVEGMMDSSMLSKAKKLVMGTDDDSLKNTNACL